MITINQHFARLDKNYLFVDIAKKVTAFVAENPNANLIKLGIGDVVLPLVPTAMNASITAVQEMGTEDGFRGYGPESGYEFLREAIAQFDYQNRGVSIQPHEVFVSDGSKCDSANIQELFAKDVRVAIPNPVYPVYLDSNVMAGRKDTVRFLEGNARNGFLPEPDGQYDLIYLCFPNNPTGVMASHSYLKRWVEYAHTNNALIVYDGAYERFISDQLLPHSIYEIDGAKEVAIELRSFSKCAGFTGLRCAYTIIPEQCRIFDNKKQSVAVNPLWARRCGSKFNGVSYPIQRASQAILSAQGNVESMQQVAYYMENANLITAALSKLGYRYFGGTNSPYIWVQCGNVHKSWQMFDLLLQSAQVVVTPGVGFGSAGEGYIRISAFNKREAVEEAIQRMVPILERAVD